MRHLVSIIRYPILFFRSEKIGQNVRLGKNGTIIRSNEIVIGSNVFIARNFIISARKLRIGNNIMIGPNLLIECEDHFFDRVGSYMWEYRKEKNVGEVTIEDDVWIGGNVTILKNTIVGEGTVIGAGSVVTKSLPPYSICVGVPCKAVKTRFNQDQIEKHIESVNSPYKINDIIDSWKKHKLI